MSRSDTDPTEAERIRQWREGMMEWLDYRIRSALCHIYEAGGGGLEMLEAIREQSRHVGLFKAACEIFVETIQVNGTTRHASQRRNGQ